MVQTADGLRRGLRVGAPILARENRDQPPVAGVEVEVALLRHVQVRLLEDEGHAQHAFPEVDGRLPVCADEGEVVHALAFVFSA